MSTEVFLRSTEFGHLIKRLEERINRLNALIKILYSEKDCSVGGPLHITIDDGNIRDSDLIFCYQKIYDPAWDHCRGIALLIFHELAFLKPAQRFIWKEDGTAIEILEVRYYVLVYAKEENHQMLTVVSQETFEKGEYVRAE